MINIKRFTKKKIDYSYVIGRFSSEIGSKLQYFPINNWQNDLKTAKNFGFDGTEWIISDFSNPIFNEEFRKIIKKYLKKNKLKICSLSLDLIMENPLHSIDKTDVNWLALEIKKVVKFFSIKRVTIPIEERSKFINYVEKNKSLSKLRIFYKYLSKSTKLCIESDISPFSLKLLFNSKSFSRLGLLLDVGNTNAHGFFVSDYIKLFPKKIFGIHIKYRPEFYSKTSKLGKKFNQLEVLIKNFDKLTNCSDITFQTFKSNNRFKEDMAFSMKNFNIHVQKK